MATQADIPDVILHKRLEVEETSLTTVQFEKTVSEYFPVEGKEYERQLYEGLETQECLAESETKQVASTVQVEVTNNVVNGNSGTIEDGSFLTSPSGPITSDKEASEQEDREVDELKPMEVEISETAKHLEKGEKLEAAEETTREDEVIEEKSSKADQVDKNLGQNVEVILNTQDSVEKEIKDSEKGERAGELEESHAEVSSKEIPSAPEVNLDHKHVQSIVETCPTEENVDNTSSTEATFLKMEFTEEKIFEETKEEDKRVDLVPEGKSSEAICSSDNGGIEDEKNQMHDDVGAASPSTVSHDESQTHEHGESEKDEVERINVANEPVDQEAGVTEKEKHEEKDEAPIETEIQDKEREDTLLAANAEEVCSSQEVDSSEILKASSETGSKLIAREIPVEVTSKTEILEEPIQVRGTAGGDVNTIESYEKELDISSRNNEEETHGKGEGLDITQAEVEEAQHTEEYSHVAAEDISTSKFIQAEEHTEVESTKHEDHADDNLLPPNEPEEEKCQTNFNVAAKEIESETLRGETTTVTPIKEETTNLPLTHSDQKTESTEAELPNNDANDPNASIFLVEQSELQSEKIGEVSELGPHEKDQTSDEAPEKEKLVEAESEGHQSTEKTIVTSTEGKAPTDVISKESEDTKEPEKDYGVSSKESFESQGAQENESDEIKKEAEVTDLAVQKFTSSQESEESSTLDDVPAEVDSSVREILKEEAPKPIDEDESHNKESMAADFNEEKISERDVAFSTPESVQEGTSKSSEDNVKDEEKLNEEESPAEIGNTTNLSLEDIQTDATETLKDHEHEAERSKEEVVEELETVGAGESIPSETNKDIEAIFDASLVKQEEGQHEEVKYLDRIEDSIKESRVELAEEEALKLRGEDEGQTQESTEENVEKEQIIERDVTPSTPESVQEETSKSSQDNIKDAENLDDLSPENALEDSTKTGEDRENEAEKSREEIIKELETARAGESSPWEIKKDIESFVDTSSEKHEEVKHHDQDPIKASIEENKVEISKEEALKSKHEDESHRQEAESNKEQIVEEDVTLSAVEAIQEETSNPSQDNIKDAEKLNEEESTVESLPENNQEDEIKKLNDHEYEAEKSTEQVVQESDSVGPNESISFETDKDVEKFVEASPIKQEESQQEGGKYQDIIKASTEENKDETTKEEVPKSKGEDEQIVEQDVTFSVPESIQEETSERSQEEINEEHPAVITKEGNVSDLSPENIEEDALKSRGDDESHGQENAGAGFDREKMIEREVMFSTPEPIQEETSKTSQDNIKDVEKLNEEESIVESIPENNQEVEIEKSNDQEYEAEKSTEQVVQESDLAGPSESTSIETNKDVEKFVEASPIKQEESQQEDGKYQDAIKASTEENKDETLEEEAPKSKGEDEQIFEDVTFSAPESIQEETSERSQEEINKEHPTVITKEGNISDLSPENIEEDAIEVLKDQENEVEESKKEVVEEFETTRPGENIPYETNKDVERSEDASPVKQEEVKQEEVKYLDPTRASVEENTPEIPDEEASKSRGDNESHGQENAGADFDREKIIEREVTFSTPESIQEETSKTSQDNLKDVEKLNEEESIVENIPENNQEVEIKKSNDQEYEAEKSTEQVVQESGSAGPSESTSIETNKDVEKFVEASPIKQEESQQEDGQYQDAIKASTEENKDETPEEEAPKSKGEDEQIFEDVMFSTPKSIQEETSERSQEEINEEHPVEITKEGDIGDFSRENIKEDATEVLKDQENKVEESKKEVVEELETAGPSEIIQCETNKDVERFEDASLGKKKEGKQEEVKYLDPTRASVEENTPEIAEEEVSESRADDESHGQENAGVDFDTEKIIEREVTLSTPKSVQEETSKTSQDNLKDEESTTEITKEGGTSNIPHETFQEDKIKTLKDHENEVEKSKEEVKEELETDVAGQSISHETIKNDESFADVSSVTKEEARQEEGEDESHKQESVAVNFDKEQVIGEEVLSTAEPIQEETSKSSYDDVQDEEKIVEESLLEITKEGGIKDFSPENTDKDAIESLKDKETDVENSKEEAVHELETSGPSESIPRETNEDVESSTMALSVKQEESQQEEEGGTELPSKGDEDQQQARQDKPEEKLGDSLHVSPEKTETEKSSEIARELTSIEAEEGEKSKNADDTNDSEKETPKEIETGGASESISHKINEDAESSGDALSVKQEEMQQEEIKVIDQATALTEESKIEEKSIAEVLKDDEEIKASDASSKGEEGDEHEEKLENFPREKLEESMTETSTENARSITCMEVEETAQNLEETSETKKIMCIHDTNDSAEIPKELETAGAGDSSSFKISEDVESSVDASSVKQEASHEEEVKYINHVDASTEENKVESTYSTEVDKEDDDSRVEVIEKKLELETKDGEDKEQAVQKDEPGEKIEDLLQVTPEETEAEPSSKIAREITSIEVEETVQNLDKTSEIENEGDKTKNVDGTNDTEKEISKELETTGEKDSIRYNINEDVESSVDTSSLKQEESQEEEVKHIDQAEVSIEEKKVEETSAMELVKNEDESKVSDVASKSEEDQQQATQKDEPAEKLENLLPETPVETETETSTENARNITDIDVEGAAQNLAETAEKEKTKHVDTTNDEKEIEIPQELETAGTINEDVERSVVTSSVKQEEDKELDQVEASKEENKVEDSFSTEVVAKEDDDSKVKLAEREIQEDLKPTLQKDEPGEKFEDVLQVLPKETETDTSCGNATSITCVEREGTIQDVEETSETENKEENEKGTDNENDSQKEIPKEFEAAGAGESTSYKMSEEVESSIDALSVKQEESQQDEVKYIDQVESSTEENKVEDTHSTEADKEDDGSKVEVTEKRIEGESKDEEDQQQAVQKDEPQGKYEDLLHVTPEEIETESSREIAKEITRKEVEETVQDLDTTSEIENEGEKTKNVGGASILEKEVRKESETAEAGVSIDAESSVDASSLRQDASQEEEVKYMDQAEAPIEEKKLEETFTTEVVKDDDASKVTHVTSEGEEDHRPATQEDEPGEKLENLLPETPVQTEAETSTEDAKNITDVDVDGTSRNLEETAELEKTELVDTTNDSEKKIEIPRELETAGTTNEDVERSVVTSLVKQEEENELDQVEASKEEDKVEDSFSTEVVKEDDDNKLKATEREIEEDLQPAPQKDEPGEKLEDVLQLAPTETEASSGNATDVTCVEGEGTIQDVAETSKTENMEETKENSDDANVPEKEISKEFEAAGACESSSYKISEEVESSVDTSSVKQEESQLEEVKYIDQIESSTEENKVGDTYSTEVDKEDDGSQVEVTEKKIGGESKDEEDQQQAVQKDEPQGKYEDLLHVTPEEAETESSREIAKEITRKEVEEPVQDLDRTSEKENEGEKTKNVGGTSISEKEVRKESETAEAGVSIDAESSVDASSLRQDASQEEEVKYMDQAEALIEEKKLEETFTTEVVKDDDESKVTHVASEGKEDNRQAMQKDEPGEKLEVLLPETPVQTEAETSTEDATNITDVDVDGTSQNLEQTAELEKTEHVDTTNDSAKEIEIPRELETAGTTNEDVERSVVTSLVKQEEENELDQVEASKEEDKVEDSFSTEVVNEDDDNKLKATEREIEEDLQPAPQKDEPGEKLEDVLQVAPEETETEASSGNAKDVTCVEGEETIQDVAETSKTENKEETKKNSDDANVQEKEALDPTNASQQTRDEVSREIGSVEEFSNKRSNTETTEETKEEIVEEISKEVEKVGIFKEETGLKDGEPDNEERLKSYDIAPEGKGQTSSVDSFSTEIASEETRLKEAKTDEEEKIKSSDDALEEKGVEKGGDLQEAKPDDEEQIKSSDAASEEKGVSSSIDIGSESKSVSTGISNEEARLKEAETIGEEQVKSRQIVTEENGLERNVDVDVQSDFSPTRIEKEETSSKEGESETVDYVKSYDVAPEEKGLTSNAVIEEKSDSVSTEILGADIAPEEKSLASGLDKEIVNEETSLTEAKAGDEERVQSRGFAPEKEDLVRDAEVDVQSTFVSAETKSEETVVKEAKTDHEEPVGSSNIAFEENNLTSSLEVKPDYEEQVKETVPETESLVTYVDTKRQPDSISADIESEGTCSKEDKPENEDKVRSLDIAPQEDSSVREEVCLKEGESDNKEDVKNSALALEEENLVSEEAGLKEVESDHEEEVKNYDIAPEQKGVSRSSIVVGDEQQNEKSEESEENKAPEVTGKFEEKIEQEIKGETPIAEIENKEQDTKVETSLEDSSEDNLQDSSVAPAVKDEPATTEATEISDVNRLVIEPAKGEGLLQEEDGSKLESDVTEKNIGYEEIQKQKDVEITTKDAFPAEVHESIEKDEEKESSKEQVTDREINLKEYQPVSIVDERVYEDNDSGPILSEVRDAQLAGTDLEDRNLVLQKSESDILQAQTVESVTKLEERSFDLDQVDEKETEKKTIVEESYAVNEAKETKLASETEDVDATRPTPAAEELKTVESKEIKEATEFEGVKAVKEDEITSEQAPDDGTSKGKGHETETTVETEEEIIKEVDRQDKEQIEASSATHLEREEPGSPKLHEEAEKDIKTAPETVLESNYESIQSMSKDEVIADQDHHVGVSTEQVQELQTTEDETTEDQTLPTVTSKDEVQVLRLEEQDGEKASDSSATKTADEEIKASDSLTEVSGSYETQEETKEASKTVCESDSRSIGVITEDKKITGETFAENQSEVQLLDQSYVLLPKEQEDGIAATAKEIEEKTIEETSSQREVEDITEASETVSKESAPDTEVVSRGINTDRALPVDKDESITDQALKIPSSLTSVPDEQEHDIAATVKNVEEEETKVGVTESVGGTRYADSPSEVLETREAIIEASNLNVEKREIASEFVSGKAESPEARTSIEEVEIIENHLKVATTEEPQLETIVQAENTTEKEISDKEELRSREISEAKGCLLEVEEVQETIQETKQPEESSQETSKESLETRITDAPPKLTDPVEETSQTTEPKDRNDIKSVKREITGAEIKKEECEEKETGGTKTESTPVISLSELMHTSKDEKVQVAAERSTEAEKAKTDEERDEEEEEEDNEHAHEHEGHEREEEDHPDAPILVQSSRDIDTKGGRKKSHGLFSGVGSKVKHSISKVKKAITGKSSHSKTLPQ